MPSTSSHGCCSDPKSDLPPLLPPEDPNIKNSIPERPTEPTIFNTTLTCSPIFEFSDSELTRFYPTDCDEDGSSKEPIKPIDFSDPYLFPTLSRNEVLRLKSLWYYGRYIENDKVLLSCLQDQVDLVDGFMEKDCVILGLLDHDYFRRVVTAKVPLAILPRREATCAHTVMQEGGGKVFMVKDMEKDWRFQTSPHVEAGLKFYAGTQLRYKIPTIDAEIAFGSLCVASFSQTTPLTQRQQEALIKFADVIVYTIVERTRSLRLAERERMNSIIADLTRKTNATTVQSDIVAALTKTYPFAKCSCQNQPDGLISLRNREPVPYSEFDNHMWEDEAIVKTWVLTKNHLPYVSSDTEESIRAIAVQGKTVPTAYLVVETSDMKQIFDDVDTWFVASCTQLICSVLQEDLLRKTMGAKTQFLRGISHELRTPIHAILSSCDLLIEANQDLLLPIEGSVGPGIPTYGTMSEKALSMLGTIDNAGRELLSAVNNLLDYDQFENSATVKVMQLHSFNTIEEEILRETASAYGSNKKVFLICDNRLPPEVEMMMTDFNLIRQCLGQLVRNAMKFTNTGTVTLQTVLTENYESLQYNIIDTGIGIDEIDAEKIFMPFEKARFSTTKGSGLGLTVASRIADLLGGTIKLIKSEVGKGSHLQLELKNPTLACPLNAFKKRVLLGTSMPLTYSIPKEGAHGMRHMPYVARKLEIMGFQKTSPEEAAVVLIESEKSADMLSVLRSSIGKCQIMLYICKIDSEPNGIAGPLQSEDCSKRLIHCLTPVRRGTLWQAIEDAVLAYPVISTVSVPDDHQLPPLQVNGIPIIKDIVPFKTHTQLSTFASLRILIVDDNPTNVSILVMYCKKRKIDYLTAVNGKEAHEKYIEAVQDKNKSVSLVLMDLDMPVQSGVDSTSDIRKSEISHGISPCMIFMVTGQNSDEDKKRSFDAGVNGYYVKPLSLKTLDDLIKLHFPKI